MESALREVAGAGVGLAVESRVRGRCGGVGSARTVVVVVVVVLGVWVVLGEALGEEEGESGIMEEGGMNIADLCARDRVLRLSSGVETGGCWYDPRAGG